MPDPKRLISTLRQAALLFRVTPGRSGRFLQLPPGAEVLIAGDMHGAVENFRLLLRKADLAQHPQRHLVLQEVVHGPFHYPGGGDKSHQLLDLLAALKCQYPERIHFLLGNHELAQWQEQRIGKGDVDYNDLFRAGVREAYGDLADEIYAAYLELFATATAVIRTENRVLLSHSLPAAKYAGDFTRARVLEQNLEPGDVTLGGWLHSLVWGRDTSTANAACFLEKFDADWLLTGHIPCDQGFRVANEKQIILDALGTPACYCLFPTLRSLTQQGLIEGIGVL